MAIQTRLIEYGQDDSIYEGRLAWDDSHASPRPGILIAHTVRGRTAFEEGKAEELAKLGYVGFALDVYGKDAIGSGDDNLRAHMDAMLADRVELQRRLALSLTTLQRQPEVDEAVLAAIGFCFGGLCVLDLVRNAAPILAAVSFHGLFTPPANIRGLKSDASVLVLHGWNDPLATPDTVVALGEEMTALDADWQIHAYGNTMHAFTNPAANDLDRGTVYRAVADRRSWQAMRNFLAEKLI